MKILFLKIILRLVKKCLLYESNFHEKISRHLKEAWVRSRIIIIFSQHWVGYISLGYISRIYIQMVDIWYGYISIWQAGYFDISRKGSEYRIFLLHKISILATGYRIWIYIHWKSVDLDMILYPKKWIWPSVDYNTHFIRYSPEH